MRANFHNFAIDNALIRLDFDTLRGFNFDTKRQQKQSRCFHAVCLKNKRYSELGAEYLLISLDNVVLIHC